MTFSPSDPNAPWHRQICACSDPLCPAAVYDLNEMSEADVPGFVAAHRGWEDPVRWPWSIMDEEWPRDRYTCQLKGGVTWTMFRYWMVNRVGCVDDHFEAVVEMPRGRTFVLTLVESYDDNWKPVGQPDLTCKQVAPSYVTTHQPGWGPDGAGEQQGGCRPGDST